MWKRCIIWLAFGCLMPTGAYTQRALVLHSDFTGTKLAVKERKLLTVVAKAKPYEISPASMTGILLEITDSTITLYSDSLDEDMKFSLREIREVKYHASKARVWTGVFLVTGGVTTLIYTPLGIEPYESPEALTSFCAALSYGVAFTGLGLLLFSPEITTYMPAGTCHSRNDIFLSNGNGRYLISGGMGIGPSYGGIGFRLQTRLGRIAGIGFHLGGGWMFPYAKETWQETSPNAFSVLAGIKLFPYRGWYVDAQFGNFGRVDNVEFKEGGWVITGTRRPYGFVFTAGCDWFMGNNIGLNLGAGMAIDMDSPRASYTFPVFDMGVIYKF